MTSPILRVRLTWMSFNFNQWGCLPCSQARNPPVDELPHRASSLAELGVVNEYPVIWAMAASNPLLSQIKLADGGVVSHHLSKVHCVILLPEKKSFSWEVWILMWAAAGPARSIFWDFERPAPNVQLNVAWLDQLWCYSPFRFQACTVWMLVFPFNLFKIHPNTSEFHPFNKTMNGRSW